MHNNTGDNVDKLEQKISKINTYTKIFIIFVIGSIFGTYYEQILFYFKDSIWQSRASVIYGPLNIVYGVGLSLFAIFLGKGNNTRKWYKTFIYSCIIGGLTEYISSFLIEKIYNMRFWNYEGEFLDICGRTTVIYIFFWGIIGFVFMKWIYPQYEKLLLKISPSLLKIVTVILTVLIALDILISFTALYRYNLRRKNIAPYTRIEKLYDRYYTNDIIEKVYTNIEFL